MDLSLVLLVATFVVALCCLVLSIVVIRRLQALRRELQHVEARTRMHRVDEGSEEDEGTESRHDALTRVAFVMNPSKHADPAAFRDRLEAAVARVAGTDAAFYETTIEDPGVGQTRQAVEDGAQIVVAAGGDGTVRMVASALTDSEARMGIVPVGTGNLLARNLDIPLDDPARAVEIALTGRDSRIDVGWLRAGTSDDEVDKAPRQIFLVMSGYGADAEMIGAATSTLKRRIGWVAYVFAGLAKIAGSAHDVTITLPDGIRHELKARTVLVGNTGRLPGGIVLMPGAHLTNGRLEVLALGWRGAAGLSQIVTQVMNPRLKVRPRLSTMERYLTTNVRVVSSKPQPVQLDGDTADEATHLVADVDPGALRIRLPYA